MSTVGPSDPHSHHDVPVVPTGSPAGGSSVGPGNPGPESVDPQLVQQTKNEIRELVQEITELSLSDVPLDTFYEEFLRRVVQALASGGGALWTKDEQGHLQLRYQINLPATSLVEAEENQQRHALLLQNVLESGQPTLVPPRSGTGEGDNAANPTDYLLVLATLRVEDETIGVVEIFQRPGGGPTTQRGYLRFLVQMGQLAADFLKSRRLRQMGDRQQLWESLEQFLKAVHRNLDTRQTCYTIVNESRRLIGCDRVSLALKRGRKQVVTAVSGLDSLDRRAREIQDLNRLSAAVTKARKPLWYTGQSEDLAPQIEEPLQEYLDQSHSTLMAVVPLVRQEDPDASSDQEQKGRASAVLGTLIIEQMGDSRLVAGMQERVETVVDHASTALANARDHESLFLLPVWRALGKSRLVMQARNLPKTLLALAVLTAVVLTLVLCPADFDLSAEGILQPSTRQEVFAHLDAVVVNVPVKHEQLVKPGDLLARLHNNSIELEIADLIGQKRAIRERIHSVKRAQLNGRLRVEEQNRLDGELLELLQVELGIERELALLREKQERLLIRSSMHGQVVTWNVDQLLAQRPVQVGQSLMKIVDPHGDWELELYMPEKRMGHLAAAVQNSDAVLQVNFILASHPDQEFTGRVIEVGRIASVNGESGNSVRLRVAIDKSQLPELRSDTTVQASVLCGQRSLGFVVFHELIETIHSRVLFWL